jgi:predicted PurR-regulated permease PerM
MRSAGALAKEIATALAVYVGGQILISVILSALFAAGFAALGVPLWYVLAPVCGFLNLIPRFGSVIALVLGIGVALAGGIGAFRVLGVVSMFALVFALEGFVLTPVVLGRRLRLRPLWVFLAVLIGGALFGFLGLLLAVPALAVATIVYKFFEPTAGE